MKFSLALLSSVLLASSALAAPRSKRGLAGRLQRRGRTLQGSTLRSKESNNSKTKFNAATGNTSDIEYSENWSGMAITSPPTGQTFNAVSGKITGKDSISLSHNPSFLFSLVETMFHPIPALRMKYSANMFQFQHHRHPLALHLLMGSTLLRRGWASVSLISFLICYSFVWELRAPGDFGEPFPRYDRSSGSLDLRLL
jgi:hypothetical protein